MKINFKEVPKSEWIKLEDTNPIKVWKSDDYLVQLYKDEDGTERLSINSCWYKLNGFNSPTWKDNLTWDELQSIKNSIGYENKWLVECYPPIGNVVNIANIRHLFVLDEKPTYAFKKRGEK
jgi:hypothetical protein